MASEPLSSAVRGWVGSPAPAVLVVDDDQALGELVVETLAADGFEAVWCATPSQALQAAQGSAFEAAVVDLQLPGMDGLALIERLRSGHPDLQCLVLTGHASLDSAVGGLRHGVFDYLSKAQMGGGALEHRVRQAVERGRLERERHELLLRLGTLAATSAAIAAEPHLDRLLEQLVSSARGLCRADCARVLLLERAPEVTGGAGPHWSVRAAAGEGAAGLVGVRLRSGEGLAAAALLEGAVQLDPVARPGQRRPGRCEEFDTPRPGLVVAPFEHHEVCGLLMVGGARRPPFAHGERDALGALARQGAVAIDNVLQHERASNFQAHVSELLVDALEALDPRYPGHSRGVAAVADALTRRLGLPEPERRTIHYGALLHDIGQLRLPETARSTADEDLLREHPRLGLELLQPVAAWAGLLPIVHAHHERWDGAGYPRGLRGEEIPLGARIVALADVFDVLERPGRAAGSSASTAAELATLAGGQIDPSLVRCFLDELSERGDPRAAARREET